MASAVTTSRIEAPTKIASSDPTVISMPLGERDRQRVDLVADALEMASVLDWLWRMTAMPTASRPSERTMVVSSDTPGMTRATSDRRIG